MLTGGVCPGTLKIGFFGTGTKPKMGISRAGTIRKGQRSYEGVHPLFRHPNIPTPINPIFRQPNIPDRDRRLKQQRRRRQQLPNDVLPVPHLRRCSRCRFVFRDLTDSARKASDRAHPLHGDFPTPDNSQLCRPWGYSVPSCPSVCGVHTPPVHR